MKKVLLGFVVPIIAGLILTEIGLWILHPIGDPLAEKKRSASNMRYIESQFYPNETYVFYPEEGLRYMADQILFRTNNMGFRGPYLAMPKPPEECRIFMVGGSTTECLYLDERATITMQLQRYLQEQYPDSVMIRVYNAGKGGDRSFDHVAMITQRIVHLDPDVIILFCGLNDLLAAMAGVDYVHLPQAGRARYSFPDLLAYLATEFQISRHVMNIVSSTSDADVRQAIPFHSNYENLARLCKSYPLAKNGPETAIAPYERNVRTIIGVVRAHGVPLMLMTQPTTWNSRIDPGAAEWHWMNCADSVRYRERDMDRAMEAYNDVLRRLSGEYEIPLVDLARMIPKTRDVIYDDCHFNINGAGVAAMMVGKAVVERDCRWK